MTDFLIRPIRPGDDARVAAIIRQVMPEFRADGPGFAIHDAEVEAMSAAYPPPRCMYFVVEREGDVLGGAGIAPLAGGDRDVCELRKMYFLPGLRGRGVGRALMEDCLDFARTAGYRHCYIETLAGMEAAQRLYVRCGFRCLAEPMGRTGHFGCDRYFLRALQPTGDA